MSVIKIRCYVCHSKISADKKFVGSDAYCPNCNAVVVVPDPQLQVGEEIGDFVIDQWLGKGAYGEVFMAKQKEFDRYVALKIIDTSGDIREADLKRFRNEGRILAKMNHPMIVNVYDVGDYKQFHYIAMEYIEGKTLEDHLQRQGRLHENQALNIILELSQALQHAWDDHQLIHRDIKPANIMMTNDGNFKLMDFGIAKSLDKGEEDMSLTKSGFFVGTPYYISPEQAQSEDEIDCRSDIFELGVNLYQMLTNRVPYNGNNMTSMLLKKIQEDYPSIRSLNQGVSRYTEALVKKMLAAKKEDRQQNYEELTSDISKVLLAIRSGSSQERDASEMSVGTKPARLILLASILLILIVGLVVSLILA